MKRKLTKRNKQKLSREFKNWKSFMVFLGVYEGNITLKRVGARPIGKHGFIARELL